MAFYLNMNCPEHPLVERMKNPPFKPDLEAFLQSAPHLIRVLEPNFTIVAANDALLRTAK